MARTTASKLLSFSSTPSRPGGSRAPLTPLQLRLFGMGQAQPGLGVSGDAAPGFGGTLGIAKATTATMRWGSMSRSPVALGRRAWPRSTSRGPGRWSKRRRWRRRWAAQWGWRSRREVVLRSSTAGIAPLPF